MTRTELIRAFRVLATDSVAPYLFSDEQVTDWLNEAQNEAAIRGRLLHEAGDASVCEIAVTAGEAIYPLHPSLYEIDHLALRVPGASRREPLELVSREYLDRIMPQWRDLSGPPALAVQDDQRLRLVPTPDSAATLLIEGYRLPLRSLSSPASEPELHQAHHRELVQWALFRAFSVPDSESLDAQRAGLAEAQFTGYFGPRPDSDLRRSTRMDAPHHNVAW